MTQNQNGNNFVNELGHYKDKTEAEYKIVIDELLEIWNNFLISQGENLELGSDYFIHKRNLFEIIKRADKRKTYYYVFHKIEKICEYKDVALLCYWINTLKPFMVVNNKSKIYNCPNEMFSLYLILSTFSKIYDKKHPEKEFPLLDNNSIQDYVYNFKYCDLSREATIFFVETLARSYGIGMETNIAKDKFAD